ncbi:MAG: YIP1 family protein, partial [Longimicrobiales bacterium]
FWRMVLPFSPEASGVLGQIMAMGAATSPLRDFLLSPLWLLVSLFVSAGVVHVLLMMMRGADAGFATTLRVFCFAYGPQLFAVVPVVGAVVGSVWMVVISIIALSVAHAASAWKAAMAVLVPLFVLVLFGVLAAMLLTLGQVTI